MASIKTASIAVALALSSLAPASAYPIDCAILLCLAGGFPPSAECSAAKATMIRRITPWPIEPPLQLWNCPMGISPDLAGMAAGAGIFIPTPGPDGLTQDIRAYRDAIEIYHVLSYRVHHSDSYDYTTDRTEKGEYRADGTFRWVRSSFETGPLWLRRAPGFSFRNNIRGVGIRTRAHDGTYQTEWVPY